MAKDKPSLLPGRNQTALTPDQERRITDAFRVLGYIGPLEFEAGPGTKTRFVEPSTQSRDGLIIVGADILPGSDITSDNSLLDFMPAAAHEITHLERCHNNRQLANGNLDEAFTSLEAACWANRYLNSHQVEQLVRDAIQRLKLHMKECSLPDEKKEPKPNA